MLPKVFDGLHGNIILVCSICGKRHVPRCKMPEAVSLGALGGKSRSKAKVEASKANGKLGGRPKVCCIEGCTKSRIYNSVTCEEHYKIGA